MDLLRAFASRTTISSKLNSTSRDTQHANDDDIYPVHMLDDTEGTRNYMVGQTFKFNDVLDAEKLHASLSRLLEIGDWRKLGGRLRFKVWTSPRRIDTLSCKSTTPANLRLNGG